MKNLQRHYGILGLFLVSFFSNSENYPLQSTGTFNNKAVGLVYSIHQSKNALWLGGENGLFKITGNVVEQFNESNSELERADIWSISEDENGDLWVATFGGGLFKYDGVVGNFKSITTDQNLSSDYCLSVKNFSNQYVVGICGGKVNLINKKELTANVLLNEKISNVLDDLKVVSIEADQQHNIWVATQKHGLFKFDSNFEVIESFDYPQDNGQLFSVSAMLLDDKQNIWLGGKVGLKQFIAHSGHYIPVEIDTEYIGLRSRTKAIFQDSNGEIWVSLDKLYIVDTDSMSIKRSNSLKPFLANNSIMAVNSIDESIDGELLLTANLKGLITIPALKNAISFLSYDDETVVGNIDVSFLLNADTLLIASNSSLYEFNLSNFQYSLLYESIGYIDAIELINPTTLLLSIDGKGLFELELNTLALDAVQYSQDRDETVSTTQVFGIQVDRKGSVYLGIVGRNGSGVFKKTINEQSFKVEKEKIQVDDVLLASDGTLYAAARDSFVYQKIDEETWLTWKDNQKSKNLIQYCILEAQDGTVWLCTNGNGLGYLDKESQSVKYIDPKFTANSTFIRELVQDTEGYFWVMTNQGLVRYDHQRQTSIRLGKEDGIVDVDFEITASINLPDNKILVAGDTLNYIIDTNKANQIINQRLQRKTEAKLVDLSVSQRGTRTRLNKTVDMKGAILNNSSISFPYDEFLFNLGFAVNNFAERNVFSFEYRLLGLDDSWTPTSQKETTATYSTLPVGNYLFEVRVIDPKSIVPQPITQLNIKVLPPLWKTWQAYTGYLLILFGLLFAFYKYRTIQLKQANKRLELSVAERTSELADSKDHIANLLAQKQSLFANVSHEFRTPLSLILGPLESLGNSLDTVSQKKNFALIYRSAKRLNLLVDQILDLAKLETVHAEHKKIYSIESSIELLIESFNPLADSKQQQVILVSNASGTLLMHQDSLEKIVSNLLSNAIKYTQVGGTIIVNSQQDEGNYRFAVSDNGPGIPDEKLTIIFDRYTRLHETREETGSGLGLAVVSELAKANNGSVQIESKLGEGSKFTIILPLYSADVPTDRNFTITPPEISTDYIVEDTLSNGYSAETTIIPERTILIIEDNAELREFLSQSLRKWFVCITAVDGVQGIERAISSVPDLIISDLMMPNKDGFAVAEAIRQHESTCHVPFILLTAKGDDATRIEGWKKQIDDYICKPFSVEELTTRVSNLLSLRDMLKKRYSRNIEASIQGDQSSQEISFSSKRDQDFYRRFVQTIEQNYTISEFGRAQAAIMMVMSERQLNRKLSALIDYNFSQFLRKYRLEQARKLLRAGGQITEVSYDVGFSSPSYFSSCFKAEYGIPPKDLVDD
jgi:signal transduction histidine kinase/DNA-binding response OmpR family regulator/ligand-binding sensor domain-containing protein